MLVLLIFFSDLADELLRPDFFEDDLLCPFFKTTYYFLSLALVFLVEVFFFYFSCSSFFFKADFLPLFLADSFGFELDRLYFDAEVLSLLLFDPDLSFFVDFLADLLFLDRLR